MSESPPEAADRDLLESIGDGDLAAFRVLYDRHAGALFAAARRLNPDRTEAEDILQEVFVAVWRRAESYRPDRGEPMGWLFSILRNKVVDYRRRRSARPQTEELAEYDPPSRAAEPTEARLTVEEAPWRDSAPKSGTPCA